MKFPASDFWDFSIAYYKKPDVEKICLSLQDNHALNVNLILLCVWLGLKHKTKLTKDNWHQLINISQPWENIISSLRQSRRLLKHSPMAMPSDFKEETSAHVSEIELKTEHMQQLALEQEWKKLQGRTSKESTADIIRDNISSYYQVFSPEITPQNIESHIELLIKNATRLIDDENNKAVSN